MNRRKIGSMTIFDKLIVLIVLNTLSELRCVIEYVV